MVSSLQPHTTHDIEAYINTLGIRRPVDKASKLASEHELVSKEDLLDAIAGYADGLVTTSELYSEPTSSLGLLSVDAAKLAITYCELVRPMAAPRTLGFQQTKDCLC